MWVFDLAFKLINHVDQLNSFWQKLLIFLFQLFGLFVSCFRNILLFYILILCRLILQVHYLPNLFFNNDLKIFYNFSIFAAF